MQSCFGTFFFHFRHLKSFQIIAVFCLRDVSPALAWESSPLHTGGG